jgi:hypothetical protein
MEFMENTNKQEQEQEQSQENVEEKPQQPENKIYQRSDMIKFQEELYKILNKHSKEIPTASMYGLMFAAIIDNSIRMCTTEVFSNYSALKQFESISKDPELVKRIITSWLRMLRSLDSQTRREIKNLLDLFEKEYEDDEEAIGVLKEYREGKRTAMEQEVVDRDLDSSCCPEDQQLPDMNSTD